MSDKKRYRVTGTTTVDGHKPGEEYEAVYSTEHERYLLAGGHLTRVKTAASPQSDKKE